MATAITADAAVIVKPVVAADLNVGHVMVYRPPEAPSVLITHRIDSMHLEQSGGGLGTYVITTKGDANRSTDRSFTAAPNNTYGKVVATLPKLGYVRDFLGGPQGKVLAPIAVVVF